MSPQLPKKTILEHLQDEITVVILYHPDIIGGPTILYKLLRDNLILNWFTYTPYPGHCGINYGLANCFFTDQSDKAHAIKRLTDIRNSNIRASNRNQDAGNRSQNDESTQNLVHSISIKFKTPLHRFNLKTGEDIDELFKMYEIASIDYKLNEKLKLQFLHNLFDGEARRCYLDKIVPLVSTYTDAKQKNDWSIW